ncbi:uncharacterized protein LOC142320646 [Lycorma delicatula]|uniref:uncharacterized protein LOC142320646 n=1 Tax=Lycorma delicatula TaxID=130591 RepID=UPI003F51411E
MPAKILKEEKLSDKTIQIVLLERERIEEAVSILYIGFFPYENICIGCAMISNISACNELAKLAAITAEECVSLIAVEKETNKIVGVCFNKLQKLAKLNEPSFFEEFRDKYCKEENSISLINFMINMDSSIDIFKKFNTDCLIEIMFIAVAPEFGKIGIGKLLFESTLELIKLIQIDANMELIPKLAISLLTSIYTYKICKKLHFVEVLRKNFRDYDFNGKWKYSDKVDCKLHSEGIVLMAKEV